VPLTAGQRILAASSGQSAAAWINRAGIPRETAFARGVELAKDSTAALPDSAHDAPRAPYVSDTGELIFDKDAKLLLLSAPSAAGVFGSIGRNKATSGPLDVELGSSSRGFATVLLTALDNAPVTSSSSLLLSIPGYSLRALPGPGNRRPAAIMPQGLIHYPGTTDWWTIDATNSPSAAKPSADLNGGWQPTFMERVEAYLTVRSSATSVTVLALDGAGNINEALAESEVQAAPGGFRIHVDGNGRPQTPWFAIAATQPALPAIAVNPIYVLQ
jgi:hypothetical protein